ncbi:MAG TPA: hypothetical protein VF032_14775 [Thermoleophilaceae bacterium]
MRDQRFFFVHMMKTAGTALRYRLINHFGAEAVYPAHVLDGTGKDFVQGVLSVKYLTERLAERGDQIRVITGHFPLCTADLFGERFTTFTLLREPVERTLSFLRDRREHEPAYRDKPLEDIYDDPFWFNAFAHNHMTKMLSLTVPEMRDGMFTHVSFSPRHVERAKEALTRMEAVGLQERYEEFCGELSARFGWNLGEPQIVNSSEPVEVSDVFRERIAEDNALDLELYEFARAHVGGRVAGAAQ